MKLHSGPLISVIVPAYEEEGYLEDLLESVKNQTYAHYEIIGIDSWSKDKTKRIFLKYKARVLNVLKGNIAAAKNAGLKKARGEIIAFIDADFVLSSNRLFLKVVETFANDNDKKIAVLEPIQLINPRDVKPKNLHKFRIVNAVINARKSFSFLTPFPEATGCVFCRSEYVKKAGTFNENINVGEDVEYYRRLRRFGKFKRIKEKVLLSYRRVEELGIIGMSLLYGKSEIRAHLFKKVKRNYEPVRRYKETNKS